MERGCIDLSSVPGGFDLQSTLESGQTYLWWREDGADYADTGLHGDDGWFRTTHRVEGTPVGIRLRQQDTDLEWEASKDVESVLRTRLRLEDDLTAIRNAAPADPVVQEAFDAYEGMRLVRGPPFPTLVSFICSTQMRVERIHGMQQTLRKECGTPIDFGGETIHAYPTPDQLVAAGEETLRDCSLGYRAPYVVDTASMVADGTDPEDAVGSPYEEAREYLTQFVGVGEKVADCVLLFSLGYLEAVPLDTWIRKTIATRYPACDYPSYRDTSRAIRDRLGGDVAGYTQTYLFHYLRNEGTVPPVAETSD